MDRKQISSKNDLFVMAEGRKDADFGNELAVPSVKNLRFEIISNVGTFLEKTKKFFSEREAEYSLSLGLCEQRKASPIDADNYIYITIYREDQLIGTVVSTPVALTVSALEEPVIVELAKFLKEKNITFPGVVGPAVTSEVLARNFAVLAHQKMRLATGQKIYELTNVKLPENIEGRLALANESHADLVGQWLYEFNLEALPHQKVVPEKTLALAEAKIKKGEVYIWLDQSGQPVSMSLVGRPTENGTSISGVYTPKKYRKNGYASAVVAGASQRVLASGKRFCVLYTDTSNPTSNKIYQEVGYYEIATSKHYIFEE